MKYVCRLAVILIFALVVAGCSKQSTADSKHFSSLKNRSVKRPAKLQPKKAAEKPSKPIPPVMVVSGASDKPQVALTFDACETKVPAGYDSKLIDELVQNQAPATLFLGGKWMEDHPRETEALARNPLFELGNHSYLHPHMTAVADDKQLLFEIQEPERIMKRLTGKRPLVFRPPYGEFNQHVLDMIASAGERPILWNLVTGDPDPKVTAAGIIRIVKSKAKNGSIIIMHMNGRGRHSAEALPAVIAELRAKGLKLVTVSELLNGRG